MIRRVITENGTHCVPFFYANILPVNSGILISDRIA